jgi:hypothetical protein
VKLKLSYDAILAPLGSYLLQYIDGEARTNPCSMGTLLQLVRLLGTAGHKLAATCCACSTCCFARSSQAARRLGWPRSPSPTRRSYMADETTDVQHAEKNLAQ